MPEAEAGGILTIDLAALAANWRLLRDRARGAECAAVVKADAYGIGIEAAVPALFAAGCRTFFVAHLQEATRARAVCQDATIYVLNGLLVGTAPAYATHGLRPVLGSREEIEEWAAFCRAAGRRLPAAVHADTGMNRLGLRAEEAAALAAEGALPDFEPALLMSHLVSADEPDHPVTARQIAAFLALRERFPGVPASLCNSSGIFLRLQPHLDLVRPGYALYGGNPMPGADNPMRPVVHLAGRIIQLRWAADGETVGYNAHWTAQGRRRIATISVGYADGYLRAASATNLKAGGEAVVAGVRCPFAGRVSMDLITIDVSGVPEDSIARGDLVTLIGDGIGIDEVGARCGTIGYEVLTSLGRRYARRYVGS
ncbi:alanine racemase [Chelatococcus sp. SYSU_G07232]|uniref:Alanine racemase n=1 Tax=Chelatococcus albus TaxID=3047466 RepID=A0ABT7AD82_9HYPH|nr:alanine racemase [Chelatococcus sp. SYSU_G07232]MDJ1156967.1 alanine racemase [Chelatococcus sp. SYSU_G07232]